MSTSEPPQVPPAASPSAPEPAVVASSSVVAIKSGITGSISKVLSQWGFPLFVLLVLYIGSDVLLPFIFAGLIAYILAPVVAWISERKDGTTRMPRGVAIVVCYMVFLAAVAGFFFLLVPRLSKDVARIGKEAPALFKKIDEVWVPQAAKSIEQRFPSLVPPKASEPDSGLVADVPLPPDTAFTMTPLPDGRLALSLTPGGIELKPAAGGGFHIETHQTAPEPLTVEQKLRALVRSGLAGLQGKLNDVVKFGQALIGGLIKGIFKFFLTLMIGAFILIDREKLHSFLRSLFPPAHRGDYDTIIAGIDKGLSGVIRGQLLICLINAIFTYIGLLIFGVKYSLILAVVAGLMSLIPIFGSILSTLPIVLAALVSGEQGLDLFRAVAMTGWIVAIHFIEANLLNPKIIGTAAKIHPVLVIFSLVLGEHSYGLVGALLAVPILSSIQVVFMFLYKKTWKDPARRPSVTAEMPLLKSARPPAGG
jgi:predicted PurR-regulated permease PerM